MMHMDASRTTSRFLDRYSRGFAIALVLGVLLILTAAPADAQLPPAPSEMEQLAFLEGEWEGSGWIEYEPGQRGEFRGAERVERRMGGRLLVVEGDFKASMRPDGPEVPVHQAFGIFSYDPAAGEFTFRTYTARGATGDANTVEVGRDRLEWGYRDPRFGLVRYTIRLTPEGNWHETGNASSDGGETWRNFFEMTLSRKSAASSSSS